MKNSNLVPFSLALSIVAIVVSVYSVYASTGFNFTDDFSVATNEKDFNELVYSGVDAYIAEKSGQAPPTVAGPIEVNLDDDPVKGNKNAPVTLVEFSDYECPFCGRYFNETLPQIMENYVDTGKVKYVFRDAPLPIHSHAIGAANAAECVRDQSDDALYWEYHDILFNNQADLSVPALKTYASVLPIDQNEFAACVDAEKFRAEVEADLQEGQEYAAQTVGRFGTPMFFINGMPVSGAQDYSVFEAAIEKALAE